MSSRRIPAYRHQKARNLAVVRLDGKDIYLGEFDSPESHAKYDQLISDWLRRRDVQYPTPQNIALCQLMAAYLVFAGEYYVKHGKPTREFGCISEALGLLRNEYEDLLVADFGPRALKNVRQSMIDRGWSRRYINKQVGRIRRMFKWGVAEEIVPVTIHQALSTVTGLKKGRTAAPDHAPVLSVPDDQIDRTLKYLPQVVADMVRLQRLSGPAWRSRQSSSVRHRSYEQSLGVSAFLAQDGASFETTRDFLRPQSSSTSVALLGPLRHVRLFLADGKRAAAASRQPRSPNHTAKSR